jgi:hypothetical protein
MNEGEEIDARFHAAINRFWWKEAWRFVRTSHWEGSRYFGRDIKRKISAALKCLADREGRSVYERNRLHKSIKDT